MPHDGTLKRSRRRRRRLAELQYKRNEVDFSQGTYRVRGDVIDVFPAECEKDAVRIELFDDEIESLSYFDPLTGEVVRRVPRLTIFPKSHYVTPRERLLGACEHIRGIPKRPAAEYRLDSKFQSLPPSFRLTRRR